jgi:hypothetical protein
MIGLGKLAYRYPIDSSPAVPGLFELPPRSVHDTRSLKEIAHWQWLTFQTAADLHRRHMIAEGRALP